MNTSGNNDHPGADRGADQRPEPTRSPRDRRAPGVDRQDDISQRDRRQLGPAGRQARDHRAWSCSSSWWCSSSGPTSASGRCPSRAIVALVHDLIITVGVYALSGFEVTPATVTGVLTILGFSLYDTVVVFDKVRENTKNLARTRQTYAEAANLAVNQTLVRSINTSIVALLPVGALLYVGVVHLGSGALKDLALALFVGMAAGAYSSIFIATRCRPAQGARDGVKRRGTPARAAPQPSRRRPLRERAGLHRGHAGPRRTRAGSPRRGTARGARAAADGGPARPRGPRCPGPRPGRVRASRRPVDAVGSARRAAADPQAALAAGQAVTAGGARPELDALLDRLVRDVADFPRPGVVSRTSRRCSPTPTASPPWWPRSPRPAATRRATSSSTRSSGMEARGFILAAPVALALGAGFVPVRKAGKLPGATYAVSYALEYGEADPRGAPGRASRPVSGCCSSTTCWPPAAPPHATRQLVERCGGVPHASRCSSSCRSSRGVPRSVTSDLHAVQTV